MEIQEFDKIYEAVCKETDESFRLLGEGFIEDGEAMMMRSIGMGELEEARHIYRKRISFSLRYRTDITAGGVTVTVNGFMDTGNGLSAKQQQFHKKTRIRDVAILTLFLGTGIRISELVGLNTEDIDFNSNAFVVTRKGGNRTILYFGDEVKAALEEYLVERNGDDAVKNEPALFLSLRKKRISTREVQDLVKKYAKIVSPLKKITPHKLRSTFGTNLYRETGDIYVVADVLGHKDVNTTKKHYAAISDDIRKRAVKSVKLRDKE